jgi:hypothetical protein
VPQDPAALFAGFLRDRSAEILDMMGSNVEALTGQSVEIRAFEGGDDEIGKRFAGRRIYLFPIEDHASNGIPALLALDFGGAVHAGAAFSLMGAGQIKEVLTSKEVPEILHDSIGEVANILCGAALDFVREHADENPEFRRGDTFELVRAGPWPDILDRVAKNIDWQLAGGRLVLDGEEKGAILFAAGEPRAEQPDEDGSAKTGAAADGPQASAEEASPAPAEADGDGEEEDSQQARESAAGAAGGPHDSEFRGLRVTLACHPADTNALRLREQLCSLGAEVSWSGAGSDAVDVAVVISRSPTDMEARVRTLRDGESPPRLVVGSSDRPTRDLVVAARKSGVGGFLVLPTSSAELRELLGRVPAAETVPAG